MRVVASSYTTIAHQHVLQTTIGSGTAFDELLDLLAFENATRRYAGCSGMPLEKSSDR